MARPNTKLEYDHQKEVVRFARDMAIVDPAYELLFAIPNAAKRSFKLAQYEKALGLKPGVPDLFLAFPKAPYHGLFIEMKKEKGVVSEHQKEWISRLSDVHYKVVVCYSSKEAIKELEDYVDSNRHRK